jgi:hypothetical protein
MTEMPKAQLYLMAEEGKECSGGFLIVATLLGNNWRWHSPDEYESLDDLVVYAREPIATLGIQELEIVPCKVLGKLGGDEETDSNGDEPI